MRYGLINERDKIDFAAIARAHPLSEVAGAATRLVVAGREWKGHCPFHADRNPSFSIYHGNTGMRWHCFAGCGGGDVIDFVAKMHGVGIVEAARILSAGEMRFTAAPVVAAPERLNRVREATAIFDRAVPAADTLAEKYLAGRGILPPYPPDLRFTLLPYGNSAPLPCVVCGIRNVEGALVGVQRIYLRRDGISKASVPKPKLSLGRLTGGSFRIGEPAEAGTLAVCEGPEDGLSLHRLSGIPVWVAAGVGNLPKMLFPQSVHRIVVGADNDAAGITGARRAAEVYSERGLVVTILHPLAQAKDWNEELLMEVADAR